MDTVKHLQEEKRLLWELYQDEHVRQEILATIAEIDEILEKIDV